MGGWWVPPGAHPCSSCVEREGGLVRCREQHRSGRERASGAVSMQAPPLGRAAATSSHAATHHAAMAHNQSASGHAHAH